MTLYYVRKSENYERQDDRDFTVKIVPEEHSFTVEIRDSTGAFTLAEIRIHPDDDGGIVADVYDADWDVGDERDYPTSCALVESITHALRVVQEK